MIDRQNDPDPASGAQSEADNPTAPRGGRRFAGELSDRYDLWRVARPHLEAIHRAISDQVSRFAEAHGDRVNAVDIGCGDGAITGLLLDDARVDVVGVDNEPKMIAQALGGMTQWIERGRLSVVEADACGYLAEQEDGSIDLVASGYVFHNLTPAYRTKVFAEIRRVVRPGGLFINADKFARDGEAHYQDLKWQVDRFFEAFGDVEHIDILRAWVLHYIEDEGPNHLMPESATLKELGGLGLVDLSIICRERMDAVMVARKAV
ncbi:MAG: class I SAM-dependent methyltransferase [Hyphomicrobiales bacterium]|nr:class I SAM-dependent methyltransferase [Hyphomicrobiales bacterium]